MCQKISGLNTLRAGLMNNWRRAEGHRAVGKDVGCRSGQ
jgi:hypothetical protein